MKRKREEAENPAQREDSVYFVCRTPACLRVVGELLGPRLTGDRVKKQCIT